MDSDIARGLILRILLAFLLVTGRVNCQENQVNPDSLLATWVDPAEWAMAMLNPDIFLDWMADSLNHDSGRNDPTTKGRHMVTVISPSVNELLAKDSAAENGMPVSIRYRYNLSGQGHWEYRVLAYISEGDTLSPGTSPGFPERISAGFRIRPGRFIHEIILGDFAVNSGFGVVAGTSQGFTTIPGAGGALSRSGGGMRLYTGTDQTKHYRGIAVSGDFGPLRATGWLSGKGATNEEVAGISLKAGFSKSNMGVNVLMLNSQNAPTHELAWNTCIPEDRTRYWRTGIWGEQRLTFGILFGEFGWSPSQGIAWIGGFRWFEFHGFSSVLRMRSSSAGYPVPSTCFQSGKGLYRESRDFSWSYRFARGRGLEWLGSAEVHWHGWPEKSGLMPGSTTRLSQIIRFNTKKNLLFSASMQMDLEESGSNRPVRLTWKVSFDSDPAQKGTVRFRLNLRQQLSDSGLGSLADGSLTFLSHGQRIRCILGCRAFSAEPGTSPLYTYEPDVRFGWSAPVISGSGTGFYLVCRAKVMSRLELEGKISRTLYTDLPHFRQNDLAVKLQIGWTF